MEDASGETKTPPALSLGRSTIEEKLVMTSPNNSRSIIEPLISASPRPRRPKNSKHTRLRNFESIDLSGNFPLGSNSDGNLNNYASDEKAVMSPSNSNHSFSRSDTQRSLTSPRSLTRSGRSKNSRFSKPNSFDSLDFPSLLQQGSNSDHNVKNGGYLIDLKCDTSPNDNLNKTYHPRSSSSRHKGRFSRQRNRRRSLGANAFADPPLPSLKDGDGGNRDDSRKEDANATSSNTPGQRQLARPHRGAQSLPSNSGHSGYSVWTEMTIHSDIYLHSNKEDSYSSSDTSAYYSESGLPIETYEPNSRYSMKVHGFEGEDDDDDSSNINFNYQARDNGSLKSISSAFSLNDMGSTGTISSLSVDIEESDADGSNCAETPDKRIQLIITPTRQVQRQQRRNSNPSFGRRRRRYSNGSFGSFSSIVKSGDELIEEVTTLDGSILDLPNLPNRVSAGDVLLKNSYSRSGDELVDVADVEEVTVDEAQIDDEDVEYFEELLNDTSDNHDDSTKRYDILISDDSFTEEIVVEVEEEEITVDEIYLNEADLEITESNKDSYSYGDNDAPNIDENSDEHSYGDKDAPNIDENSDEHSNGENQEGASNVEVQIESGVDSRIDPPDINDELEYSADQCSNDHYKSPSITDDKSECNVDYHDKEEVPSTADEKAECIVDSQNNKGVQDAPPNNNEELESSIICRNDKPNKDPHKDFSQENCNNVPPTMNVQLCQGGR